MDIEIIIFLSSVFFIAGFIDSIAGGGGILTVPALLFAGVSPQAVLGTSKFASTLGTGVAVLTFMKNKKILWKVIAAGILFSVVGSFLGSKIITLIQQEIVEIIIIFMLPVGIIATLIPKKNRNGFNDNIDKLDLYVKIPIICFAVGFYDGFFGPGTGAFLTLSFYLFTKMNLVNATANAKVFNFASNFSAMIVFSLSANVLFSLGIPLALANIAGNFLGSRLAIKKGEKIIKLFLTLVFILLLISLIHRFVAN
ncbi:TSUP family transporter [Bacteroidales bacterium OttesenSCG-928-I21]|nr:TSUP family transporter [Bacteroidales bacterium OttesenSCG-928-I21]